MSISELFLTIWPRTACCHVFDKVGNNLDQVAAKRTVLSSEHEPIHQQIGKNNSLQEEEVDTNISKAIRNDPHI